MVILSPTKHGLNRVQASVPSVDKMSHEENIQIFVTGVEDARREQQARGHEVGPAVDFKLTVDLSKRNLYEVPQEVVELLRAEVER